MTNLEIEFKKLNFALDSYPCDYTAVYEDDLDGLTFKVINNTTSEDIYSYRVPYSNNNVPMELMTEFKKEVIKRCVSVKKEKV